MINKLFTTRIDFISSMPIHIDVECTIVTCSLLLSGPGLLVSAGTEPSPTCSKSASSPCANTNKIYYWKTDSLGIASTHCLLCTLPRMAMARNTEKYTEVTYTNTTIMAIQDFILSASESKLVQAFLFAALFTGIYRITNLTLSLGALLADIFVLPATNFSKYGAKKGKWAVITGASDGIGKEYALQLAKKGLNVVLVSRTASKLEALADEITAKYGVEAKYVAFDASTDAPANYELLRESIAGLPVTVLINNVGQSHSIPVPFMETEEKELVDIITLNNTVTLKITQIVAPLIAETVSDKSSRGLILTMGSFGGLLPTPYLATYSGSKAFLQQWSAALAGELKPQGIDVELVVSYLVASAMSKIRRTSATIPSPKAFVQSTLASVGRRGGAQERYATSTPFWTHALMHFGIENTVGVYSSVANKLNLSMHKSIRARALKKAARNKKD